MHDEAQRGLAAADPDLARWMQHIGPLALPTATSDSPYTSLLRAIAHQQLHARAAQSLLARLAQLSAQACPDPEQLLRYSDAELRACGFSASKVAALRDLARHTLAGLVPDRQRALTLSDAELIALLTQIRGIGRWTVEMMLIQTLGRCDVLPADDLGVRRGYGILRRLEQAPTPRQLADAGRRYAPWRSLASLYLWRISDARSAPPDLP